MKNLIIGLLMQFDCPESMNENWIMALILRESKGDSVLVSSVGAIGLMQVRPGVIIDYNNKFDTNYKEDDLFNPLINLKIGIWHLCRYRFKTNYRNHLFQIYFVGFSRWKEVISDPDHELWDKLNWYIRTIRFRYFVLNDLERIK